MTSLPERRIRHRGREGRTLDGRYRLERRIGAGGMSVVWRGYDMVLGRPVAVKLLRSRTPSPSGSHERVLAEARTAARLAHPNVASVYDFGKCRLGTRWVSYLVMELLNGDSLATHLRAGPLDWASAARVCADVAAGLSASHACGVVHRDIKPANVMLTATGAKLVDFGIAAAIGQPEAGGTGSLLGTPAYLAPERLRGEPAVPGSDVYGLGVMLYHCLTGRLPWDSTDQAGLIAAHLDVEPHPLPVVDGVPAQIGELCLRCLRKRPENRPTARHVALTLARAAKIHVNLPARMPLREAIESVGPRTTPATSARRPRPAPTDRDPGDEPTSEPTRPVMPSAPSWSSVPPSRRSRPTATLVAVTLIVLGVAVASVPAPPGDRPSGTGRGEAVAGGAAIGGARNGAGAGTGCVARYATAEERGARFSATLIVDSTSARLRADWMITFRLPEGQRVLGAGGASWTQLGQGVALRSRLLSGGEQVTVALELLGAVGAGDPTEFALNGLSCHAVSPRPTSDVTADDSGRRQADPPRRRIRGSPTLGPAKTSPTPTSGAEPATSTTPDPAGSSSRKARPGATAPPRWRPTPSALELAAGLP